MWFLRKILDRKYWISKCWIAMNGTYPRLCGKILDRIADRLENARKPSIQQSDYQITKSRTKFAENPESNFVKKLLLTSHHEKFPLWFVLVRSDSGMRLICDNIQDQINWRRGTVLYRKKTRSQRNRKRGGDHTWYLSQISQMRYVEKNLSCGEISNLYAWQMWRNLTFLHLLSNLKNFHMTDVEKSEVSPHLACIWCGECLYICTRYAVLSKKGVYCDLHRFVAKSVLSRFTHFCVEKNGTKYCVCGEKMTNIRYETTLGDSAAIQPLIIWMFKAQVLRLRF